MLALFETCFELMHFKLDCSCVKLCWNFHRWRSCETFQWNVSYRIISYCTPLFHVWKPYKCYDSSPSYRLKRHLLLSCGIFILSSLFYSLHVNERFLLKIISNQNMVFVFVIWSSLLKAMKPWTALKRPKPNVLRSKVSWVLSCLLKLQFRCWECNIV